MRELYWVVLVSHLTAFAVAANAYHIVKARTTWKEATDLCQRNGSILAVLDSQQKTYELSIELTSLGYRHGFQKFWIGLVFNASTGQFVWSSGIPAQDDFINSACRLSHSVNNNFDWCYVLKNKKANSSCFEKRPCWNALGYICQAVSPNDNTSTEIPSFALETSTTTHNAASSVLTTLPRTIPSSITSHATAKQLPSLVIEKTPTATPSWDLKTTTSSISTASSVLNVQPTKKVSSSSSSNAGVEQQSSILLDKTPTATLPLGLKTITTSSNITSIVDDEVKDKIESNNPVAEFISVVASLDPEDPRSLEMAWMEVDCNLKKLANFFKFFLIMLLTDAYQDFATSMKLNTNIGSEDGIIDSARAIEDFAFKYASSNLNSSRNQERRANQQIVIQVTLVPKGYAQNFTFTKGDGQNEVARITLPSYLFQNQDTIVVNVLYSDLHKYVDNVSPRNNQIDSTILGSSVKPSQHGVFTENVTIVLRTLEENGMSARKTCVFWKWNDSYPANGSWSGDGCSQVESNRSHVVCTCNHLTNFAILMNIKRYQVPEKHRQPLNFITYIGLGISLLGETITILAYMLLLCSRHDQQSHVHVNLVATLAIAQMIFLAGIDATQDQVLCLTVAASIHYLYLSSFCWMLIEGVMLYLLIIEVYNTELKLPLCYLFSFGFPGVVVGGTLLVAHLTDDGIYQYRAEKWCWLSTDNFYIWSFAAPVILIAIVNVAVFCGVVREMVSMPSAQSTKLNAVKTTVKACIVLFPLLGVTWLFCLLSIAKAGVVPQYIFTVLNSLQGFLIFLLHCVRNTEVRSAWNKKLQNFKKKAWRFFNIRSPPASSTSEAQSYKPEGSEMELGRKNNKIAPVEG